MSRPEGAVVALSDRVRLDGAVATGLTRRAADVIITVGATLRLF